MMTLDTSGFQITEVAGEWLVFTADFGEGYEAAALAGAPEGTRMWTIRIDVVPDGNQAPLIESDIDPSFLLLEDGGFLLLETGENFLLESGLTRAQYLWRFFRLSKASGNEPFWFEFDDPDDGVRKQWLASFADHKLSYEVLCAKVYGTGLTLKQRRVSGVASPIPAE